MVLTYQQATGKLKLGLYKPLNKGKAASKAKLILLSELNLDGWSNVMAASHCQTPNVKDKKITLRNPKDVLIWSLFQCYIYRLK